MRGLQRAHPDGLGRLRPARGERRHQDRHPPARVARCSNIADMKRQLARVGRAATTGTGRSPPACPTTTGGRSGSSSSSTSAAWPTRPRRRSTGARPARPCWPTSRWSTARCERCDVRGRARRSSTQWFFKITDYAAAPARRPRQARRLAGAGQDHAGATGSAAARARGSTSRSFRATDGAADPADTVPCFTTRVDTIYGCTYMVLAPEHPRAARAGAGPARRRQAVLAFVAGRPPAVHHRPRRRTTREKNGRLHRPLRASTPTTARQIPLWVGDYVLMEYGTGAVMAVPAHDTRDLEFAKKYGLPIRVSIQNPEQTAGPRRRWTTPTSRTASCVDSGPFAGLPNREAIARMTGYAEEQRVRRAARSTTACATG